mmetsp:Transcript_14597/g.37570  ORF Transcript_14597/g.37570 Transcript_14597/m.37570 type:complete len:592 (+) Transcript_14597:145-1920(+)
MGGKNYCPECFICHFCEKPIRSGEGLSMKGEKRCCARCKPFFCNSGCGEYCPESDRIMLDGINRPYRLACLKCNTCAKQLYRATATVFNANIYCQPCSETAKKTTVDLSQPCAKCEKKITGSALLALGKQWCSDCFVCSNDECGAKLEGKFFDIDGMPYCKDCRVQAAKKKPTAPPAATPASDGGGSGENSGGGKREPKSPLPQPPGAAIAEVTGAAAAAAAGGSGNGADDGKGTGASNASANLEDDYAIIDYTEVGKNREYAEVDDTPALAARPEQDYDNSEFAGTAPLGDAATGAVLPMPDATYDEDDADADYDNADAGGFPPPIPTTDLPPEDSELDYDNADHAAPPLPAAAAPLDDPDYDNAEHDAPPPPPPAAAPTDDPDYDNADHAPVPPPLTENAPIDDPDYDNADHAPAPPPAAVAAPTDELDYDNSDHGSAAVGAPPVDVDALVQQKLDEKMAEMERKIREQVEAEMRRKASAGAEATPAPGAQPGGGYEVPSSAAAEPPNPRSKANSVGATADPLNHQRNPLYVSAGPPQDGDRGNEKSLLNSWMKGSPDNKSSLGINKYNKRRELPKPRTQSLKPSSSSK